MNADGQTVCLSMIVKNEAPVIRRCLDSVRPIIDYWIIVDTGSTDDTQDIIRAHLKDLPGELHERAWRDFAYNRSEALTLARPHGDYTLIIDADDALMLPQGYRLPSLTADSYTFDIHDTNIRYQRSQMVRNTLEWHYRGVLHEFLTCDGAQPSGHLPIIMRRNHDGARRRDPQTYRKDAAILETALGTETDPFLIARYSFYLAQSYRDSGEKEKAVAAYLRRAELGYWDQEVFCSLYKAAEIKEELGHDKEEIVALYLRASAVAPNRAEALHGASRLYRHADRFREGCDVAKRGLALTAPVDGLFVETWIYDYGLLDEFAVNAYWAGDYRASLDTSTLLLARGKLPDSQRDRIDANARFALAKLASEPTTGDRVRQTTPSAPIARQTPPRDQWIPDRAQGGTELMVEGLSKRLDEDLKKIRLCVNLYQDADLDGRPLVVWIHHDIDQEPIQWLLDKDRVSRVAWFVFVSEWQRARFLQQFDLRPEICVVLRNSTTVDPVNRRWAPNRPVRLAYTSTPFRGLSVLLDAWALLRPVDAELHIWSSMKLYGPNVDDQPFQSLYERSSSLPGVHHHGIVPNEQLRQALRDIDFLVYPSTFAETSCLSVIEAMAAGCRVICPTLGALPETTGRFARVYPFPADPTEHARRFADILAEEIRNPWGGNATLSAEQQDYARGAFDWSVRVTEWKDFIGRATGAPPVSPTLKTPATAVPTGVTNGLLKLKQLGFEPTGILDIGAYEGWFAQSVRSIFPDAYILMADAIAEKAPILDRVRATIGNADYVISLLGAHAEDEASFFVVNPGTIGNPIQTGSSKFKENTAFPTEERIIRQTTLEAIVNDTGRTFQLLKLDVQGAELEVVRGLGSKLAMVDVILMELSS
jgi:FkbM family methyltransferase